MIGVEILAVEECATKYSLNMTEFGIAAGIILCAFVIFGIIFSIVEYDWNNLLIWILNGIFIGAAVGLFVGTLFRVPIETETRYKVVISDEVSMDGFVEKYEIIDQEGKIFTIREKD